MNKVHFDAFFDYMVNEVKETRDAGQKEYAHTEDDVFANFKRTGDSIDTPSSKVLMTFLLKHIDGINAYIKGHDSQREDVTGRIKDAITYLFLLWAMIEGEKQLNAIKEPKMPPGSILRVEKMS
tara:strand:+ start:954 stop:1325 length:372 start_codon:yes stop_codon:yes gene_type:complete